MKENTKITLVTIFIISIVVFLIIVLINEQEKNRNKLKTTIIECEIKTNDLVWCLEKFN